MGNSTEEYLTEMGLVVYESCVSYEGGACLYPAFSNATHKSGYTEGSSMVIGI